MKNARERPHVVFFHQGVEMYGSDRMLLEAATALIAVAEVTVVLPARGALAEVLLARGAVVVIKPIVVIRKSMLQPQHVIQLICRMLTNVVVLRRFLKQRHPDLVYVSTIVLPSAVAAARLAGVHVVCHVHEAERMHYLAEAALTAPLLLAATIIAPSEEVASFVRRTFHHLGERCSIIENGLPDVDRVRPLPSCAPDEPALVLVGRLSPRKGSDVAIDALALLRECGVAATLTLVGDCFPGYEWFEDELRRKVDALGIADAVTFAGFQHDCNGSYDRATIVLVPSRVEPFGLVAVEGQLHERPVVASAVGGLTSIVDGGRAGVLVEPGSAEALCASVLGILSDWEGARMLAREGRASALARFTVDAYRHRIRAEIDVVCRGSAK